MCCLMSRLALDTFQACKKTTAPLLELQQAIDYLLAFWAAQTITWIRKTAGIF